MQTSSSAASNGAASLAPEPRASHAMEGPMMAGGGCLPQLLVSSSSVRGRHGRHGPAAGMDDLVGETILGFLTVADAVRAAGTCKAAAAAQEGGADFRRIAGMRFKHLDLLLRRLPRLRSLHHLDLGGHENLGPKGCEHLAAALVSLAAATDDGDQERDGGRCVSLQPRLRRLELAGCRVGAEGCHHLVRALEAGAGRALTVLDLSANQLWDTAPLSLARALAAGASPALVELNLSNNFISASGAAEIARALRAGGGRRLQTLNLSSNELHAEGLRELLGAFLAGACPQLSDLGLASNCLGVQGAMELGRALQAGFGPNLQRLSLASNNLGSLGLQVLMDATAAAATAARRHHGVPPRARPFRYYHINPALLAQNQAASHHHLHHPFLFLPPTRPGQGHHGPKTAPLPSPLANLRELSLFLNEIRDQGAAGLALGLVQGLLPSLRELDVSANRLGPAGVVGIVSALEALHHRGSAGLRAPPPPPPPPAQAATPTVEAKARAKQAAAAAGAPLVDLSFNLLPEERGAVSHAALPQGVLI